MADTDAAPPVWSSAALAPRPQAEALGELKDQLTTTLADATLTQGGAEVIQEEVGMMVRLEFKRWRFAHRGPQWTQFAMDGWRFKSMIRTLFADGVHRRCAEDAGLLGEWASLGRRGPPLRDIISRSTEQVVEKVRLRYMQQAGHMTAEDIRREMVLWAGLRPMVTQYLTNLTVMAADLETYAVIATVELRVRKFPQNQRSERIWHLWSSKRRLAEWLLGRLQTELHARDFTDSSHRDRTQGWLLQRVLQTQDRLENGQRQLSEERREFGRRALEGGWWRHGDVDLCPKTMNMSAVGQHRALARWLREKAISAEMASEEAWKCLLEKLTDSVTQAIPVVFRAGPDNRAIRMDIDPEALKKMVTEADRGRRERGGRH